jgi:hypothetical protein
VPQLGRLGEERLAALVRERWRAGPDPGRRICLFLGAGADIAAGGLTFWQFKRLCFERLTDNPAGQLADEQAIDQAFERVFAQDLPSDERARLIEKMFREAGAIEPSEAYSLLALLVRVHGLDSIVTTNFDTMLERAADNIGGRLFNMFCPQAVRPAALNGTYLHGSSIPYVKIHGDLASSVVTVISAEEIAAAAYEQDIEGIVSEIASSQNIVFAGYSGFDTALAQIIANATRDSGALIFWCNPSPPRPSAPLAKALGPDRFTHIPIDFNRCIEILSRAPLERPSALSESSSFLGRLLHWRIDFANREFENAILGRQRAGVPKPIRRQGAEAATAQFLKSDKALAVVAGPSGYGKTTLIQRIAHRHDRPNSDCRIAMLRAKTLDSANLEQSLMCLCAPAAMHAGLGALERWLRAQSIQLTVVIDALNEFSPDANACLGLFRNCLRIAFSLPENSQLRLLVSMRHETWNYIYGNVDAAQLSAVMWSPSPSTIRPISLDRFSSEELEAALAARTQVGRPQPAIDQLNPRLRELLRDPFLLGIASELGLHTPAIASASLLLDSYVNRKLSGTDALTRARGVDALTRLAGLCHSRAEDRFRPLDLDSCSSEDREVVRLVLDSGLILPGVDGMLQFEHDRTQEHFLSLAIGAGENAPPLETLRDLVELVREGRVDEKLMAAARRHLRSRPERFELIALGQQMAATPSINEELATRVRSFTKEALVEAAFEAPDLVAGYAQATLASTADSDVPRWRVSAALQSAALLPRALGLPVLEAASRLQDLLLANQATVHLVDGLADELRDSSERVNLLHQPPFDTYLLGEGLSPLWGMIRLLGLSSALGPDNLGLGRYPAVADAIADAIRELALTLVLNSDDLSQLASTIRRNLDRYLFNGLPEELEGFFSNDRRREIVSVLDRIVAGEVITGAEIVGLGDFYRSFEFHFEFLTLNVLFALSSLNDFDATTQACRAHAQGFTRATPAEEIDFFTAVEGYRHVVAGRAYAGTIDDLTRRLADDLDQAFFFDAGQRRGGRRGWRDTFDMMFEDGFNPIAGYPLVAPAGQDPPTEGHADRLPVMSEMVTRLLQAGANDKVVRIIHALGQTIGIWPEDALASLGKLCGARDPLVRRALVRVLTEAFARRPLETQRLLDSVRGSLTEAELTIIRSAEDTRLGGRQFETIEWARILRLLIVHMPGGRSAAEDILRIFLEADSLEGALGSAASRLGLYPSAAKK